MFQKIGSDYYETYEDEFMDDLEFEARRASIPEQYAYKACQYAWREGHANGFHVVYMKLLEIAEMFKDDQNDN